MPLLRILFALIALLALNAAAFTQVPPLVGETLEKRTVDLRKEAAGRQVILVFGFSRESQAAMRWWTQHLEREFTERSQISVYQIANLESAPFFVRGMIKSGMRSDVPPALHRRFLVMTKHAKDWKSYLKVSPQAEDNAYFLALDKTGSNVWSGSASAEARNPEDVVAQIRNAFR